MRSGPLRVGSVLMTVVGLGSWSACAPDSGRRRTLEPGVRGPTITGLSTLAAAVGEPVEILGTDFVPPADGWVDVSFQGQFFPDDGAPPEEVDITIPLQRKGEEGELAWERFGAYQVPFGRGDRPGRFVGEVFGTNQFFDGRSVPQPDEDGFPVEFTVLPSLVALDFRAVGSSWVSDCKYPSTQPLNLVPYALRVKAAGFEPLDYNFTLGPGLILDGEMQEGSTKVEVPNAVSNEQAILTRWAPVPENAEGYRGSIHTKSMGTDGIERELNFPFVVRRPMQVFFSGQPELAELYEPVPVTGCIWGGPASTQTSYNEMTSETRSRSVGTTFNTGWQFAHAEEHTETVGRERSEALQVEESEVVTLIETLTADFERAETTMFRQQSGTNTTTTVRWDETQTDERSWRVEDESVEDTIRGDTATSGIQVEAEELFKAIAKINTLLEVGGEGSVSRGNSQNVELASLRQAILGNRRREVRSGETEESRSDGESEAVEQRGQREDGEDERRASRFGASQTVQEANGFRVAQTFQESASFAEADAQSDQISLMLNTGESNIRTVSSTEAVSLNTQAHVWAEQFGVWYRQTSRLVNRGRVITFDLCGNAVEAGEVMVDDFTWAPGLSLADQCPPLPVPGLPQASCVIEPCSTID